MYAHARRPPPRTRPFENRALLFAVRQISASLVKRAGHFSRDLGYSDLLSDIWGQSHYATLDVLHAKREHAAGITAHKKAIPSTPTAPSPSLPCNQDLCDPDPLHTDAVLSKRRDADRDRLVALLRRVTVDDLAANEHRLTVALATHGESLDIDAVRRLWGVPHVVFEAAQLPEFLRNLAHPGTAIPAFHLAHIAQKGPDARIFCILLWYEQQKRPSATAVSKDTVARVVRLLLTKRRSPFFEKNMSAVIETVLYAVSADPHVSCFRLSALRAAGFFQGLQAYEYSRSFTGALANLQLGRLNRMLKDVRAVRAIEDDSPTPGSSLSLRAVERYCAERDTLTERALHAVVHRHTARGAAGDASKMTEAEFVRMYLSLIASGTDPAMAYWFTVLDQDGDGRVGPGDIAHFYAQRKYESEKRNGIVLADARCLWVRICAMCGVSPLHGGIDLGSLKGLGREDREFVMCALLVRRVDDGNLTNVAATMTSTASKAR